MEKIEKFLRFTWEGLAPALLLFFFLGAIVGLTIGAAELFINFPVYTLGAILVLCFLVLACSIGMDSLKSRF
jgi:hypothetical protein